MLEFRTVHLTKRLLYVGAAEGCDLLIFKKTESKDRSVPQLLQGEA
jgi:hypothetical protein